MRQTTFLRHFPLNPMRLHRGALVCTGTAFLGGVAVAAPPDETSGAPTEVEVVVDVEAEAPGESPGADANGSPPTAGADAAGANPEGTIPENVAEAPSAAQDPAAEAEESVEVIIADTPLRRTAGSAQVIGERELERYEYDDAHAVLASVPGVYVRTEDGMGLRPNIGLRGVNPERSKKVTLLEDGVLFGPAPYSAPAAYFFPLMTRMSSVRVIKGPGAVSYGPQTVGGTIDLISRPVPSVKTVGLDGAFGGFGYLKGHAYVGGSAEQTGVLIEGVHLENNGFKWLENHSDTGFSRNEWVVKLNHVLDPLAETTNTFRAKLSYSDELSNETYLGLTTADFARDPNFRYAASNLDQMNNHRMSIVLTHELETLGGFRIKTDAYRHDYERSWRKVNGFRGANLFEVLTEDSARADIYRAVLRGEVDSTPAETLLIGPNHRWYVSQGVQSVAHARLSTGPLAHRIELGARYHFDRITRRHSEDSFVLIGGEPYPDGGPTTVTASNSAFTHALALHVVDAIDYGPLTFTPGIRTEIIRSTFEERMEGTASHRLLAVPLPGAGAHWDTGIGIGLLAGVYRGFSPPEPGSSSDVEPESSWNYEAGTRFGWGTFQGEVIGFLNDYGNLSDVCTFATGCTGADVERQFNAGEALIYGAESSLRYEPAWGNYVFPLQANYTWTHGEFSQSFSSADPIFGDVEKGDEMPYLPRHQWRASVALEHANGGLHVAANYVAAMREVAGQGPLTGTLATEALLTVDIGGSLSMGQPFSLYANVNNLFDEQRIVSHRPFGARPNAPRWVQAGVKAKF